MISNSTVGRYGSGREVLRIEDRGLLAGNGRFTDDVSSASQLYLTFLRSSYAHARIVSIDAAPALAMPGVIAVLTGADLVAAGVKPLPVAPIFKRPDGSAGAMPLRPALADGIVRFVGEAVAAVVAETLEQAKDAAEAIVVDYEPLPVLTEMTEATAPGATLVWPAATGNITAQMKHGDPAACDAAFASAAHVVSVDVVNQRLAPTAMEPRSVLAEFDAETERLTLRLSSQMPSGARDTLLGVLGLPAGSVRVVVGDVGGGFGMKTGLYPPIEARREVEGHADRRIPRRHAWPGRRKPRRIGARRGG
jgi:carbon-monoxide dehydrogenase large subunit